MKMRGLKCSPIRIGGFEMTSHTNKSLLLILIQSKDWINFDKLRITVFIFLPLIVQNILIKLTYIYIITMHHIVKFKFTGSFVL